MADTKIIQIPCGTCGNSTNHIVIAERNARYGEEEAYCWGLDHYFCQCAGCDSFCYAVAEWSENDWNPRTEQMELSWSIYPSLKDDEKQPIYEDHEFPPKIRSVYREVIGAFNAQLPVLTAIGLRALIEAICKDQGVKAGKLYGLIDGLANNGVLTAAQASILHSHRFLGNAAAHDIEPAKPRELIAALEIAEAMLRTIYVLPGLAAQIKTGKKPQRKPVPTQ
jgi:hypothetical protein